jgi:hypothetical protein
MKNKSKPKYISLKEAAKISGYAPDYIGYLIRKGKIPGKPVYWNVAWMTTAEAVLSYKNGAGRKKEKITFRDKILEFFKETKEKFLWEAKVMKLFIKSFRYVLPIIIILILSFSILVFYILRQVTHAPQQAEVSKEAEDTKKIIPPPFTY